MTHQIKQPLHVNSLKLIDELTALGRPMITFRTGENNSYLGLYWLRDELSLTVTELDNRSQQQQQQLATADSQKGAIQ